MQAWVTKMYSLYLHKLHQQLHCSCSVISLNPVSVIVTPLLVSAHCTKHTFLQGNALSSFGFKQRVSCDQFKGLRECKRTLRGEMCSQVSIYEEDHSTTLIANLVFNCGTNCYGLYHKGTATDFFSHASRMAVRMVMSVCGLVQQFF